MNRAWNPLRALALLGLLLGAGTLRAQQVDTIEVFSPSMRKTIKNLVITPARYPAQEGQRWPVVYLLHGYNNRYDGWLRKTKPELPEAASAFGMIFVCPDGAASWYWDSPADSTSRYETYLSRELPAWVDTHYRTVAHPDGRAVTGYSMGGHGALWLTFRHPDVFGACGSMSGGVDFRPFPKNWKIRELLGEYADHPERWEQHTVMSQLYRVAPPTDPGREVAIGRNGPADYDLQPGGPAILIDCGTDDFFYEVNLALHERMHCMRIAHDFIVRPGNHTHTYWRRAVDYHLLFFRRFFDDRAALRSGRAADGRAEPAR